MLRKFWLGLIGFSTIAWIQACSHFQQSSEEVCLGISECAIDPSLESIAKDIDHIEKHIDCYGSIVAKHPDVWGSARLTKYQQEVEAVFIKESDPVNVQAMVSTYQGSRSISDQAFLASAVAINAAITGQGAGVFPPASLMVKKEVTKADATGKKANADKGTKEETTNTVTPKDLDVPTDATIPEDFKSMSSIKESVKREELMLPLNGFHGEPKISLEPTMVLNEKKRFLDHLNEIRRVNEGDDNADSPGYALYLMRVPVSVLPGKKTDRGHGAEVTMSVQPVLGNDLLPVTFRNLVINDLVDQYSEIITAQINSKEWKSYLYEIKKIENESNEMEMMFGKINENETRRNSEPDENKKKILENETKSLIKKANVGLKKIASKYNAEKIPELDSANFDFKSINKAQIELRSITGKAITEKKPPKVGKIPKSIRQSPRRASLFAYPVAHYDEVIGFEYCHAMILDMLERIDFSFEQGHENRVVHLHEVRATIQEQALASYRFLSTVHPQAWSACNPDLVRAVRDLTSVGHTGGPESLQTKRTQYGQMINGGVCAPGTTQRKAMEAFGWALLVESALLNDQLVRDMKETMGHRGVLNGNGFWQDYYLPDPSPSARQAFNDYVNVRWPIYTFAVDPVLDQQNIQDTLRQRRELQLALSLALASGSVSVQNATRFARRLEADYQTVDLNQTVVGFSHGDNVFGWRFYPRFQTPDIPGNLMVISRDLLLGRAFTQNQELHSRRLEPGQRECVALVVMPSFVPYAEVNVSTSWFSLANPKHKTHTTKEGVLLGKKLKAIENCKPLCDQDQYRPGDLARLLAKANMLEARLPLQDMQVQVPYENTLGGFEFFNSGISDLTPQLHGWYGREGYAGGVDQEIFLMGDNFTVTNTKVLAGGKNAQPELLSRQVMKITIPKEAAIAEATPGRFSESGRHVEVTLATPYGTSILRIPVYVEQADTPKPPVLLAIKDSQKILEGKPTVLILEGENFTNKTQAFAGGKSCPVEFIGPKVIKVMIPKNVDVIREGMENYVELKAATEIGVSDPIRVPVINMEGGHEDPAELEISSPTFKVGYKIDNLGIKGLEDENKFKPDELEIKLRDEISGHSEIILTSEIGQIIIKKKIDPNSKSINIGPLLAKVLISEIGKQFGPESAGLKPIDAFFSVTLKSNGMEYKADQPLFVEWIKVK